MTRKLHDIAVDMAILAARSDKDKEADHIQADELLKEALLASGAEEAVRIVDSFERVGKWYS